jgi:hypothetical protein
MQTNCEPPPLTTDLAFHNRKNMKNTHKKAKQTAIEPKSTNDAQNYINTMSLAVSLEVGMRVQVGLEAFSNSVEGAEAEEIVEIVGRDAVVSGTVLETSALDAFAFAAF